MKRSLIACLILLPLCLGFMAGYAVGVSTPQGIVPLPTASPAPTATVSPVPTAPSPTETAALSPAPTAAPTRAPTAAPTAAVTGRININTATLAELCSLPGIGETIAGRILAYRESHGPFLDTKELMLVSGIGEKRYENIRDLVCAE